MYMYTVQDVVERLEAEGITSSKQVVQRWLREGKIEAEKPQRRKDGYRVSEGSLERFIASWKEKHTKRTAAEYEAEIQRIKEELERSHAENTQLREELERAEERNSVLTRDLFDALDKLENKQKEGAVNWKKKYDQLLKSAREKADRLIAAEQEIHLLKMQLQDLREQKSVPVPDEPAFTERFQFEKKKYEVRVYVREGKYAVHFFEGWGRFQKDVKIDKSTPLFKRFLEIVREKRGVRVEMALASWQQLVPID